MGLVVGALVCSTLLACQPVPPGPVEGPTKVELQPPAWARYTGTARTLSPNAGWCWWQSRRAVIAGDTLLVGSVPNAKGPGGVTRQTHILSMDLQSRAVATTGIGTNPYPDDDHNSPGIVVGPDGSVTAAYTGHNNDDRVRVRTVAAPSDTKWQELPDLVATGSAVPQRVSYANLVRSEGLLWNFTRRSNRTWVSWSGDDGLTWTGAWLLSEPGTGTAEQPAHRPYIHVAANPVKDRIDFVATDGHPRDIRSTALHSGYIQGTNVYRTDGVLVGPLVGQPGYRPSQFTTVARPPELHVLRPDIAEPARSRYADADLWGSDLVVDAAGNPALTFSTRLPYASTVPGKRYDHSYSYARWTGTNWAVARVAHAGGELYAGELDYTGLITIDPTDPTRVVMSSNADPVSSAPLVSRSDGKVHYELFEGLSADGGATWSWRPITRDSTEDNLRPLLAGDATGRWALVWMQGTYSSWVSWSTRAMVMSGPQVPLTRPATGTKATTTVPPATAPAPTTPPPSTTTTVTSAPSAPLTTSAVGAGGTTTTSAVPLVVVPAPAGPR